MQPQSQTSPPSPLVVFGALNGYQHTNVLKGAIDLDLFTAIAEGNSTVDAIAKRISASTKGTRVLCDYLTIDGFLKKDASTYSLEPVSSTFLDRRSPAYLGDMVKFLLLRELTRGFDDIAAIVRKGGTVLEDEGTVSHENPIWVEFARSMACLMRMPAELLATLASSDSAAPTKVLDIAAGHGLFGIAIAKRNPKAEVVALDWRPVLEVAKENAAQAGVADRYSTIAGSAFEEDLGSGYNLVLLTNFLHHFGPDENATLLRRIHSALAPGGRVLTVEFIPNDDRISPPMDASFSMMMLGGTQNGDAYTLAEYERMFSNAGFQHSELRELAPAPQRVIVSYK